MLGRKERGLLLFESRRRIGGFDFRLWVRSVSGFRSSPILDTSGGICLSAGHRGNPLSNVLPRILGKVNEPQTTASCRILFPCKLAGGTDGDARPRQFEFNWDHLAFAEGCDPVEA
jgi:hypothetical protein